MDHSVHALSLCIRHPLTRNYVHPEIPMHALVHAPHPAAPGRLRYICHNRHRYPRRTAGVLTDDNHSIPHSHPAPAPAAA